VVFLDALDVIHRKKLMNGFPIDVGFFNELSKFRVRSVFSPTTVVLPNSI